jgi:hypothetical protein
LIWREISIFKITRNIAKLRVIKWPVILQYYVGWIDSIFPKNCSSHNSSYF